MYTHGHHESVLRSHRWRTAGNSAAYLVPHLRPGLTLLDIGAGPGTITADLAALVSPGRVVVADVHALELPDDSFDVVHAHQVVQHVADPVRALAEMRRVCRPGGIVAARDGDYAGFTWYPEVPALDGWLALYRTVARRNGGEPDAGRRLLSWARAAGFTDVTPGASTWCFATPDDRQWWGRLWADRIRYSDLAGQLVDHGLATTADLERVARAWLHWADTPDGWLALLHGEILCRA